MKMALSERPSVSAVPNQVPALVGYNLFEADAALREASVREGASFALPGLGALGERAGRNETLNWAIEANESVPRLRTHDRVGDRIDEVTFHPSWHRLMETATTFGVHASPWREPRDGAHVARAAAFYVWGQIEAGHGCPISMTYACIPALRAQPSLAQQLSLIHI